MIAVLAVGFGLGTVMSDTDNSGAIQLTLSESTGDLKLEAERSARMAKSPSSSQAVLMADQARNLIFPMIESRQLSLSLAMFREAIRKDEMYFGGYAGAAQCLAAMAIYSQYDQKNSDLLAEARRMVDRAEELSPVNSWTQSALSWVFLAEGHVAEAKEHADISIDLAPNDGNVLDFYSIVMVSSGNFEKAREASDSNRLRTSGLGRFANKSLYGAASFHLEQYQEAIDSLNAATTAGDPISAPTLAYLAASHQRLGNEDMAKHHVNELMKKWPAFDPLLAFDRLYVNPDQTIDLSNALVESGWAKTRL